ncbi:MAG: shikimate kinase [Rhodospirillaceae bacterium]|nr:MAG: shikimate kinase [Rhodospirillaceae bacterium]
MDAETRATIRARAVSVWLKADLDVLVSRTAGRTHRPLLNNNNPRAVLARLMAERYPVYAMADIIVESTDRLHETMVEGVVVALRYRFGLTFPGPKV